MFCLKHVKKSPTLHFEIRLLNQLIKLKNKIGQYSLSHVGNGLIGPHYQKSAKEAISCVFLYLFKKKRKSFFLLILKFHTKLYFIENYGYLRVMRVLMRVKYD